MNFSVLLVEHFCVLFLLLVILFGLFISFYEGDIYMTQDQKKQGRILGLSICLFSVITFFVLEHFGLDLKSKIPFLTS